LPLRRKRWELLNVLCGAGPVSIREASRRIGRDVKTVHADVQALLKAGILQKTQGRILFPYDSVRVNFMLHAA
jgi:predicted transcriptional regulator